jgi:hypothetical protein
MRCDKCGFKKDLGKGARMLFTCPQCGEEAGAKFDIYEVPVDNEDIALLKKIKSFLETIPSKSISLEELEQGSNNSGRDPKKPTNYWL